ncbi:MAG: hypothetical protein WC436_03335 [Candidatus Babeliales bacterium]
MQKTNILKLFFIFLCFLTINITFNYSINACMNACKYEYKLIKKHQFSYPYNIIFPIKICIGNNEQENFTHITTCDLISKDPNKKNKNINFNLYVTLQELLEKIYLFKLSGISSDLERFRINILPNNQEMFLNLNTVYYILEKYDQATKQILSENQMASTHAVRHATIFAELLGIKNNHSH